MAQRDIVFRQFGPKLTEALLLLIFNEINKLREEQGMSPRTEEQVYTTILNHISDLPDYDWMQELENFPP